MLFQFFWIYKKRTLKRNFIRISDPNVIIIGFVNDLQGIELLNSDLEIYTKSNFNIEQKIISKVSEIEHSFNEHSYDLAHLIFSISSEGEIVDKFDNKINLSELIVAIQNSGVSYLILAKENEFGGYEKCIKDIEISMNIVMTIDRKGNSFVDFFIKLFKRINSDKPMPVAWHELAPQIPGKHHENTPEGLCIMGAANILLLGSKST